MDDDTYQIIGAAFEVHSRLGSGFLEAVYQEALHHGRAGSCVSHQRKGASPQKSRDVSRLHDLARYFSALFLFAGSLAIRKIRL
jgi:hypothetical protein